MNLLPPAPPGEGPARRPKPPRRREAWRQAVVPTVVSIVSVLVVFGALGWWVSSAEQWPRVRTQFFSLDAMVAAFPRVLQGLSGSRCAYG